MKEINFYHKQKVCFICKKEFSTDDNDIAFKKYRKYEIIAIKLVSIEALLTIFVI